MTEGILEFYKILAVNPEGFNEVMQNLTAAQLQSLMNLTRETYDFINQEEGDARRNRFIVEELNKLPMAFDSIITDSMYFRRVKLNDDFDMDKYRLELIKFRGELEKLPDKFESLIKEKGQDNFKTVIESICDDILDVFGDLMDLDHATAAK